MPAGVFPAGDYEYKEAAPDDIGGGFFSVAELPAFSKRLRLFIMFLAYIYHNYRYKYSPDIGLTNKPRTTIVWGNHGLKIATQCYY